MHLARSTQKVHNLQVHGRVKPKQHKGLLVRSGVLQSLCHWIARIVIKCGKRNYKASPIEVYDICPYCEMVINPYIRIYITFVRIAINTVYIIYIILRVIIYLILYVIYDTLYIIYIIII